VDNLLLIAAGEEFHENTWIELDPIAAGLADHEEPVAPAAVEEEPAEPDLVEVVAVVEAVEPVAEPEPEPEPEPPVVVPDPEVPEPVVETPVEELAVAGVVAAETVADDGPEPEHDDGDRLGAAVSVAAVAIAAEPPIEHVEPDEVDLTVMAAAVVASPDALAEPDVEEDTEEDASAPPAEQPATVPVPERPARHTFDPLGGDSPSRRRWRRRDDPYVEVPARPPAPLALPGASRREP
jgi:hypothetical protein